MQTAVTKNFVITLTEEEFVLLHQGLGETSFTSRLEAGMTEAQSQFISTFYASLDELAHPIKRRGL